MKVYVVLKIYTGESAEVSKVFSVKQKADHYANKGNKESKKKRLDDYICYQVEEHEVEE